MYMAKNIFFLDIKNNTIKTNTQLLDSSKSNNSNIVEINYSSKYLNSPEDLLKNINKIFKKNKVDNSILENCKNLYVNDDAITFINNNKIISYGNDKKGGKCLYNIVNPDFIIPTPSRFISSSSNNIYVWGNMNYTFNDVSKYLRFSKWNIIVNKNNTYYIFNDNKRNYKQTNDYNIKKMDGLLDMFSINNSEDLLKYLKTYLMKRALANMLLKKIA
jgi:hypothetical protein